MTKSVMADNFNFLARYTFGNKKLTRMRLCHWNKGGAFLHNKINEIEQIISKYKPHIIGISEANFHKDHSLDDVRI